MLLKFFLLSLLLFGSSSLDSNASSSGTALETEEGYTNWVSRMGFRQQFKQSLYSEKKARTRKKFIKPCLVLRVSKKPRHGQFPSVKAALHSVPVVNTCRVLILVSAGTYRTMAYVTVKGAGADKTVIEWHDTADTVGPNGQPLGTYASATFAVNSPYFIAKNITFKNKAPLPSSGVPGKQAVALRVSGDAAAFVGCRFIGSQDTLYDHTGRHYFKECYVEGSVDFVFGNGRSYYEGCHLHAISSGYGAVTAQKRGSLLEETGFSFVGCKVTGSGALYLGRAWGTFSMVVFAHTFMDRIVTPAGWYDWGDKSRDMTVFYGQYKCIGPGAAFGQRVAWSRELTPEEAKPFISLDFIDGRNWLPLSGLGT